MSKFDSFEGTWEEIVEQNSAQLAGQRVRVVILPEKKPQSLEAAFAGVLGEIEALKVEKPVPAYPKPDPFYDELKEKYGKQGFKL